MGELIQSVQKGVIEQTKNSAVKDGKGKNQLGKDAFLQLLVTQMKYQDPLNPSTDTEYIAQLATFSQLEQMQNLGTLTTNSQAFSLVGKNVIVKTESEAGNINYISGRVDFVNVTGGKAQISINGKLYPVENLDSVIDETYLLDAGRPRIDEKAELTYDAEDPKDLTFTVYLGEGESLADDVAVMIDTTLLDSSVITLKDNKITIDKSVFENAPNGSYKVTVAFNDPLLTTVRDKVSVTVKNSSVVPEEPDETPPDDPPDDSDEED